MTFSFNHVATRRMRGLTLVELMISMTIGLVLMVVVTSAYLGSASAGRIAEAQGRMNEDAQAALTILAQQIRMAGDNPRRANYDITTPTNPVFPVGAYIIRGCDGNFAEASPPGTDIASLTCAAGTNTLPDSIAVSYEADQFNTVKTVGGIATDCLGNGLSSTTASIMIHDPAAAASAAAASPPASAPAPSASDITYFRADSRYYVATPASSTTPSLYCKGNAPTTTAQPLVDNIEDLQVTYGVAPATAVPTAPASAAVKFAVAGYLTANQVETEANLAALADSPSRWAQVISVKLCVLVRSEALVVSDSASARYYKCDGTLENNPADLRLRRAYFSTVVMRNRVAAPY